MVRWIFLFLLPALTGCTQLLFHPTADHVLKPDVLGIQYEDISLASADGTRLHGWWLYAQDKPRATVLFLHGNAQNISNHIKHVYWLVDYGYNVVTIDYRGYGASAGSPDIAGSLDDIRAAVDYVSRDARTARQKLLVVGQSLGGSFAIAALAATESRNQVDALVVISAFSDYRRIVQDALAGFWLTWALQWPLSYTVDNGYSPEKMIARLAPVPVVIMHGKSDEVVPVAHASRLYKAAAEPKFLELMPGDHNHILGSRDNRRRLLEYLDSFVD